MRSTSSARRPLSADYWLVDSLPTLLIVHSCEFSLEAAGVGGEDLKECSTNFLEPPRYNRADDGFSLRNAGTRATPPASGQSGNS